MSRYVVAAMAAAIVSVAVPAVAGADSSGARASTAYSQAVQVIDDHFFSAVATAKHTLVVALRHARTAGQRSTARARYNLAIAVATTERDQELVNLGTPPKGDDSRPGDTVVTTSET